MAFEEAWALRIRLGEADRIGGEAAYKHLVRWLRKRGVAGATAVRGLYGYGARSVLHTASPLRLSTDLPILIEAIDSPLVIEPLLAELLDQISGGCVTVESVRVVKADA